MKRILVLEDNPDMLSTLSEILEINGFIVIPAYSGREGLTALEACDHLPDLILSDLNMPDMDGLQFIRQVRSHERWNAIPVAVMSGMVNDEPIAINAGADAFVNKPFRFDELERLLSHLIH
jgi:CheY-like chemotaxis protein